MSGLTSLAVAPLTAWQSQQHPNPKPHHSHRAGDTQQDRSRFVSYSSAPGRLGGANSTGSWGGSVGGGVEGSGGGVGFVADLVGQDQLGRPLTGTCRPVSGASVKEGLGWERRESCFVAVYMLAGL